MRLTNAIPRQLLTANTRRLRLYWADDASGKPCYYKVFSCKDLMFAAVNGGLTTVFAELKVHRLNVYYQSDSSTSTKGSYCLVVADNAEDHPFSKDVANLQAFTFYMCMPGSMIRRVYQNASGTWFPTEPSDREWHTITGDVPICEIFIMHSDAKASTPSILDGRVMVVADVSVRGRANPATTLQWAKHVVALSGPDDFEMLSSPRATTAMH